MSWSRAPLPALNLSQESQAPLMVLAQTVLGEAEGEPDDGKLAVAYSVVNRAEDVRGRWSQDISKVCLQPFQYSCWLADSPRVATMRAPSVHVKPDIWEASFRAACAAMYKLRLDPTHGANHYLTTTLAEGTPPSWFDPTKVTARIAHHLFLRL